MGRGPPKGASSRPKVTSSRQWHWWPTLLKREAYCGNCQTLAASPAEPDGPDIRDPCDGVRPRSGTPKVRSLSPKCRSLDVDDK